MDKNLDNILNFVALNILDIKSPTPLIIGIDGKDASGKTTFADNLSSALQTLTNRKIIRISLDNFFQPRAIRSQKTDQARGCYEDTFDTKGIIENIFNTLDQSYEYTTKIFDYKTDSPVEIKLFQAGPDAILIIDGVFLHRPEFHGRWDYTVLLEVADEVAIERGAVRDSGRIGGLDLARQKYISRYIASQKIYYTECSPEKKSNLIIDNTDFRNPLVID